MSITSKTKLATKYGEFNVNYHTLGDSFCVSLSMGNLKNNPLVRIHSACLFSEAFHSIDCDCNLQLTNSIKLIAKNKNGIIIYLYQEGRGHGLYKKIKAVNVMREKKIDTVEAFKYLKFELDIRDYSVAIEALRDLKADNELRLISNNPRKIEFLENNGYKVNQFVLKYPINDIAKEYMISKRDKLKHKINWLD